LRHSAASNEVGERRPAVSRWVRVDRRYNQPYRLTGHALRAIFKWTGLVLLWALLAMVLGAANLGLLTLVPTVGLMGYAAYCVRRVSQPRVALRAEQAQRAVIPPANWRFNPPPDWPEPPFAWTPPPGWQPDPSWPSAPPGWQFWVPAARGAVGERNTRVIPQDVRIQVSVRDQGRCVQCGSAEDLQYDHKIPWSKGGANTVNNIQLLCGTCNRHKGANDVPVY
jgi:HNH endonuclease